MIESTTRTGSSWQLTDYMAQSIHKPKQQDIPRYKMMLKNITPRLYQETILGTCVDKNCLVVLPTGLGKTVIALMMASQRLKCFPNTKILFLAPTRPLVEQHIQTFKKHFDLEEEKMAAPLFVPIGGGSYVKAKLQNSNKIISKRIITWQKKALC